MYYNHRTLYQNDGVVIYIKHNINENIKLSNWSVLCCELKLNENCVLKISALYRCKNLSKEDLIGLLSNCINHCIILNFNIDILNLDKMGQNFLNSALENGYLSSFQGMIRPAVNLNGTGSCNNNVFMKLPNCEGKSYKIKNLSTYHYHLIIGINKNDLKGIEPDKKNEISYKKMIKKVKKTDKPMFFMHYPNIATDWLIDKIIELPNNGKFRSNCRIKENLRHKKSWPRKQLFFHNFFDAFSL